MAEKGNKKKAIKISNFTINICKKLKIWYNNFIGISPSGKATVSESVMRWFESNYPSHNVATRLNSLVVFIQKQLRPLACCSLSPQIQVICGVPVLIKPRLISLVVFIQKHLE